MKFILDPSLVSEYIRTNIIQSGRGGLNHDNGLNITLTKETKLLRSLTLLVCRRDSNLKIFGPLQKKGGI